MLAASAIFHGKLKKQCGFAYKFVAFLACPVAIKNFQILQCFFMYLFFFSFFLYLSDFI